MTHPARFLVIGGAGFLGKRVVDRLRGAGHIVSVFDAVRSAAEGYIFGDITRMESLWDGFAQSRPEVAIQLAYLLGPESRQQPYLASQVNVNGMTNVFEASRLSGVRRVVYASSVTVHGLQRSFGDVAVNESSATHPDGPYAAMKLFNEHMAAAYRERYKMEMIGVRFSNLFGHGRVTGSSGPWASSIVSNPALGRPAEIPVSPLFRSSMLYVGDAAEYVVRLALLEAPRSPWYLTGGYDVTVSQMAEAVGRKIAGAEIRFTGPADDPGLSVPVFRIDSSLIVNSTGYSLPPLEQRIADHAAEARTGA